MHVRLRLPLEKERERRGVVRAEKSSEVVLLLFFYLFDDGREEDGGGKEIRTTAALETSRDRLRFRNFNLSAR